MKNKLIAFVIYFIIQAKTGRALNIAPKVDFGESDTPERYAPSRGNIQVFKPLSKDSIDPLAYTNTVIVNQHVGPSQHEKSSDGDDEINYVCKNRICVYGIDKEADTESKSKKVISDVQVIISTSDDTQQDKPDSSDVPVIKGFKGVRPEDINHDEDGEKGPKNDKEQPSIILTSSRSGGPIVINPDVHGDKAPSIYLQSPKFEPANWKGHWKSNDPSIPDPWYNQRDVPDIRPQDYPHKSFQSDRRHDAGFAINRGHGVRIPSGWSSNWRPVQPPPADHFHYNVGGRGQEYPEQSPGFVTVCSCSRKPVRGDGAPRPRPRYPETTPRPRVDDKLAKPFSKT